jgi:hypothetical protein
MDWGDVAALAFLIGGTPAAGALLGMIVCDWLALRDLRREEAP